MFFVSLSAFLFFFSFHFLLIWFLEVKGRRRLVCSRFCLKLKSVLQFFLSMLTHVNIDYICISYIYIFSYIYIYVYGYLNISLNASIAIALACFVCSICVLQLYQSLSYASYVSILIIIFLSFCFGFCQFLVVVVVVYALSLIKHDSSNDLKVVRTK